MDSPKDDRLETRCADEAMVYDPSSGAVHVLNRTAARIRELAAGGASVPAIAAALRAEFAVPEGADLEAEVSACLAALRSQGLA